MGSPFYLQGRTSSRCCRMSVSCQTAEVRALIVAQLLQDACQTGAPGLGRPAHRIFYLPACDCMAFSICSLTASRLKLAPF